MVIVFLALVLFVIIVFTFILYKMIFAPRKEEDPRIVPDDEQYQEFKDETVEMVTALMEREYEKVSIISYDALRLCGRWYEGEEDKPTAILFHGYRGSAYRDFSGGSAMLFKKGWNVC